jgi:hypothetical protein
MRLPVVVAQVVVIRVPARVARSAGRTQRFVDHSRQIRAGLHWPGFNTLVSVFWRQRTHCGTGFFSSTTRMGAAGGDIAAACCTITVAVAEAEAAGAEATITFVRFFAAHGAHGSTGSPIAGSR